MQLFIIRISNNIYKQLALSIITIISMGIGTN